MVEYIDKQTVLNDMIQHLGIKSKDYLLPSERALYKRVEQAPAADVVEVVRCKDCKWCHAGYCEKYDDLIPFGCANKPWDDWFCADGEKKNG